MAKEKKLQSTVYRKVCSTPICRNLFNTHSQLADVIVFHAGTEKRGDKILQTGGRTLNITATASTLQEAVDLAYKGVDCVSFEGMQYRKDIAHRLVFLSHSMITV